MELNEVKQKKKEKEGRKEGEEKEIENKKRSSKQVHRLRKGGRKSNGLHNISRVINFTRFPIAATKHRGLPRLFKNPFNINFLLIQHSGIAIGPMHTVTLVTKMVPHFYHLHYLSYQKSS